MPQTKEKRRLWREQNKEKIAQYRVDHKDHIAAYNRRYKLAHHTVTIKPPKSSVAQQRRDYKIKHPERVAASRRNNKANRKKASGRHSAMDILAIWNRQKQRCAVPNCTHPLSDSGHYKYHVDHVTAINNGGSNDPTNLQILCRHHNREKHAQDEYEWAQQHGRLFF